jgi:hypothetical protein
VEPRRDLDVKNTLEEILADAHKLSERLEYALERTTNYDLQRQLKKVDAELIDFQHSLSVAIEMEETREP